MQSLLNYVPGGSFIDPECFHFWTSSSSSETEYYECEFGISQDKVYKSEFGHRPICLSIYEIRNSLKLLHKLKDNKLVFSFRNHPIMRVKVFGLIRQVSDFEKYYKCFVQDDSHTINCLLWKNDFVSVKTGKLPPVWGDFVLLSAFIKQMDSSRILDIYEISLFHKKSQSLAEEVKYLELRNQHRNFLNTRKVKQTIMSYWPVCSRLTVINETIEDETEPTPVSLDSCVESKSEELMGFFTILDKHLISIEEIIETKFFDIFRQVKIILPRSLQPETVTPVSNAIFILDCVLFHLVSENLIVKVEKESKLPEIYVPFNDKVFVQSILSSVKETKPAPTAEILIQMLPGIERTEFKVKLDSNHLRKVVAEMEENCLLMITNGVLRLP